MVGNQGRSMTGHYPRYDSLKWMAYLWVLPDGHVFDGALESSLSVLGMTRYRRRRCNHECLIGQKEMSDCGCFVL